ncbi:MAG: 4a-hydroxytetrahydrobiopterin dehydratase [Actinomycetota bacterium]|jgi:4a-hydroxytetrahydrobiopterin dehydratase|nr:4a-hydroxytetrahydrobiopterin dehydratase [Actinomycetota bacterium]
MVERVVGTQFHEAEGVEDWRVVYNGAKTFFATGSFEKGVALVDAIAKIAIAAGHHPDIDLRYNGVIVRVWTYSIGRLTDLDIALARQISAAARELDIPADPSKVQTIQIAIDAMAIPEVLPFWKAVLGYSQSGDEDIEDPLWHSPNVWFQQMDAPRPQRNRFHIDISLPRDQADERIAAALAAGGHIVSDAHAPDWWTLADSEGNEVDIAPWMDDLIPNRKWD